MKRNPLKLLLIIKKNVLVFVQSPVLLCFIFLKKMYIFFLWSRKSQNWYWQNGNVARTGSHEAYKCKIIESANIYI